MSIVESREVWNQFDRMVGAPEEEIDLGARSPTSCRYRISGIEH